MLVISDEDCGQDRSALTLSKYTFYRAGYVTTRNCDTHFLQRVVIYFGRPTLFDPCF